MGVIEGVLLTPLKIIDTAGGDVLHALKQDDPGFNAFGEAYFSTVNAGAIKAWKRHHEMVLNLVVSVGAVRFVLFDDRPDSTSFRKYQEIILSRSNYQRLTVPPMLWMGFQGVNVGTNMLLNIASIPHRSNEMDRLALEEIEYYWEK
jgi:dTDP-4-dehydrorhamnose 3,5-epimerase